MVILLVLCILVLLVIAASYVCCRLCFFVPKQTEEDLFRLPDTEQYAPHREAMTQMVRTALALPYEDVWIRSDDGLRLHGKYYAGRPGAPAQIMMHGYKSGAERDFCGGAQIAVFLFKVPDALFDHLLEFAVFCPAFLFCDVAELVQQRLVDAQCVPAQVVFHFAVPP